MGWEGSHPFLFNHQRESLLQLEDYYILLEDYSCEGSTVTSFSENSAEEEIEDQVIVQVVYKWLKALLDNCPCRKRSRMFSSGSAAAHVGDRKWCCLEVV